MKTRAKYTPEQLELRRKIRKHARQYAKKDEVKWGNTGRWPGWVAEELAEFTYKFLTEHGKENME